MNETAKQPNPLKGIYIMLAVLLTAVLGCVILCAATLSMTARAVKTDAGTPAETRENDVTIADEYVILSTEHISDAYRSGDRARLSDRDKETLDMAAKVLDEIITGDMTPFDKEEAVYLWMVENLSGDSGLLTVIPTSHEDAHHPYGVLKYRTAVCVGYATTFRLFMQMLDIPCMVIHNTEAYHSWNLVQLDGNWYHVDVYGAIGAGSYHSFNLPDLMMAQEWDQSFFPAATSLNYNPAYMAAEEVSDIYAIPQWLRGALDGGEELAALKFGPELTQERLAVAETMLNQIQFVLSAAESYQDTLVSHTWCPTDDGMLLVVYLARTIDDSATVDEGDQERIDTAIDEAFGDLEILTDQPDAPDDGWKTGDWVDDLFDGL